MTNFFHDSLKGRVVLITGGSRGFGWHMAEKLLEGGAKVALTGTRTVEDMADLVAKADSIAGPGHCITIQADVRSWDDCQHTVKETLKTYGRVDVLINNAGRGSKEYRIDYQGGVSTKFWDVPIEAWRSVIDTNLTGVFQMTKAVVPHMIKRKFGKVFSISTSLTTMIGNSLSPYGASKSGLETAHIVWAKELAEHNVDVNILLPGGASDTDFIPQTMVHGEVGTRGDKILPGDVIVPPAVWLCTDETNNLTGRRIIAKFWEHDAEPDKAFEACLQPKHDHPEIM